MIVTLTPYFLGTIVSEYIVDYKLRVKTQNAVGIANVGLEIRYFNQNLLLSLIE